MSRSGIFVQGDLVDPVVESRHSGEDGGFLLVVATQTRDKAGNAMNLPDALRVLTVQGATRVTLEPKKKVIRIMRGNQNSKCDTAVSDRLNIITTLKTFL